MFEDVSDAGRVFRQCTQRHQEYIFCVVGRQVDMLSASFDVLVLGDLYIKAINTMRANSYEISVQWYPFLSSWRFLYVAQV